MLKLTIVHKAFQYVGMIGQLCYDNIQVMARITRYVEEKKHKKRSIKL